MALPSLLLLAAVALAAVAAWQLLALERDIALHTATLRRAGSILLEIQGLKQMQQRMSNVQRLSETAIDLGTDTVRAMHLGIANIPFGILEAVPVTRGVTRVVRQTHNLIADAVYSTIKGVNRGVGGFARLALRPGDSKPKEPGPPA